MKDLLKKEEVLLEIAESGELSFDDFSTSELVDFLKEHPRFTEKVIESLEPHRAVKTIKFLELKQRKKLINNLPPDKVAMLIRTMHYDDRTALLGELPSEVVKHLVLYLPEVERVETLSLLGYPEYTVGRLMNPEYIEVKSNWTVQNVLDEVRKLGRTTETINFIYVVDEHEKLIDDINLKEFLIVSPDKMVSDLMDNKYIALEVDKQIEEAATIFRKSNRVALPVIDNEGILLGIVTIDDILRAESEEATEDIQKIGGTEALDEPYMEIAFKKLIQKRAGWLVILFLGEMLTATAMGFFQDEISKVVVLALFIPLIISSGGNSGSQASTLIIRAMALGEITFKDWWRVMRREIFSGLALGSILGIIGFFRICVWHVLMSHGVISNLYGVHWLLISFTVSISLVGVVLWGTLAGSMLPLILKKLGADPASSSAPFVATLVDVTGLIIYFVVASLLLSGTLL